MMFLNMITILRKFVIFNDNDPGPQGMQEPLRAKYRWTSRTIR